MPEVGEMPVHGEFLANTKTPRVLEMLTDAFKTFEHASRDPNVVGVLKDLVTEIPDFTEKTKAKNPDIDPNIIDNMVAVTFGPLGLPVKQPDPEKPGEREAFYRHIRTSAAMQHSLAHTIFYASQLEADPQMAEKVFKRVSFMDFIARSELGRSRGYEPWWNGVKSEVAVIRALKKNGFDVELPDYSNITGNIDPQQDQLMQWDIKKGVDMVATRGTGRERLALFVDSKGTFKIQDGNERLIPEISWGTPDRIPADLALEFASELAARRAKALTIILPTRKYDLSGVSSNHFKMEDKRTALAGFGVTSSEGEITQEIGKIEMHSRPKVLAAA